MHDGDLSLAGAGHGTLAELQLRWFERHVTGVQDRRLDTDLAPPTWYEINSGQWCTAEQWNDLSGLTLQTEPMTAPLRIRGSVNAWLLESGEVAPVVVEISPTGAVVPEGHRLRVSVQAFDVPHLLPTLPDVLAEVSPLTLHPSPEPPSTLTLPTIPIRQQNRR